MFNRLWQQFWPHRTQFIRYFVIGFSGFLLDIFTLYLCKEWIDLTQTQAVLLNQPFIIAYVFALNRLWSFRSSGVAHQQLARFFMVACGNYMFSAAWIWLISEKIGVQYLIARTLNVALAVSWNFLIYKHWVYKETSKTSQIPLSGV